MLKLENFWFTFSGDYITGGWFSF